MDHRPDRLPAGSYGYRCAQRHSMGIASLNAILRVSGHSVFVGCGGPRRLERSDTHRSIAQPSGFIGLPRIVVMGFAWLNATAWVSLHSTPSYGGGRSVFVG
jgi:hypothetical protein